MSKKFPCLNEEAVRYVFLEEKNVTCIPNAPGRAPIYKGDVDNYTYAFKFVSQTDAQNHVNNTKLFDFFELPFVPCYAMSVKPLIQEQPRKMHQYTRSSYPTYLVIMPFIHQTNLKDIKKNALYEQKNMNALNANILSYYTELVLTHCTDFYEKNILVEADISKNGIIDTSKPVILNPNEFTLIDANDGRMSHQYRYGCGSTKIETMMDLLNATYAESLISDQSVLDAIKENAAVTCEYWRSKISTCFPKSFEAKRRGMKENMLHNLDHLEERLKLSTPEFFSY